MSSLCVNLYHSTYAIIAKFHHGVKLEYHVNHVRVQNHIITYKLFLFLLGGCRNILLLVGESESVAYTVYSSFTDYLV